MYSVERLLYHLNEAWSLRGWSDRGGVMVKIARDLARGRTPTQAVANLTAEFKAVNRLKRQDVVAVIEVVLKENDIMKTNQTMNLLFVSAGPSLLGSLRLGAEERDIREKIRATTKRDNIKIDVAPAARRTDLIDAFGRYKPNVLHISGHGDNNSIVLEDDNGDAAEVSQEMLTKFVGVAGEQLRLVVLNTCESARLANHLTGTVDAAIGMDVSVNDDVARVFAVQLYSSLGEGLSLQLAFDQAALQIEAYNLPQSDNPRLFVRKSLDANKIFIVGP